MATTRMTFGALLGTVTTTADTLTKVVSTVSNGVDMANRFVESASVDQKDRQVIHRKVFRDNLLRESRMNVAKANREVVDFCEDAKNKELYNQAQTLLTDDIFGES